MALNCYNSRFDCKSTWYFTGFDGFDLLALALWLLGASGSLWEPLGASGSRWELLGASGSLWEPLGTFGSLWEPLWVFGTSTRGFPEVPKTLKGRQNRSLGIPEAPRGSQRLPKVPRGSQRLPEAPRSQSANASKSKQSKPVKYQVNLQSKRKL